MPKAWVLRGLSRPCRPHGTPADDPRCRTLPVSTTGRLILFRDDDEITQSCFPDDSPTDRVNVPRPGLLASHEGNGGRSSAHALFEQDSGAGELPLYLRSAVILLVFGMKSRLRIVSLAGTEGSPSGVNSPTRRIVFFNFLAHIADAVLGDHSIISRSLQHAREETRIEPLVRLEPFLWESCRVLSPEFDVTE